MAYLYSTTFGFETVWWLGKLVKGDIPLPTWRIPLDGGACGDGSQRRQKQSWDGDSFR